MQIDVRKIHHPFLSADDVAYFLGLPGSQEVFKLVKRGGLDVARLPDGSEFRPTKAVLFRAVDVGELLKGRQLELFIAWQRDELRLPGYYKKDGRTARQREAKKLRGDDRERLGKRRSGR